MHIFLRSFIATIFLLCSLLSPSVWADEVRVAVASNFAAPMEDLAKLFQKESGHTLKLEVAASGKLYAQIKGGAAFDVFLSADEALPRQLMQDGLAVIGSRFVYARGKLVLWSVRHNFVDEKGAMLRKRNYSKLAITNPWFSPYGEAAKETLSNLTMWNSIQEKLTKGENVIRTYQLAVTEGADLALISLSQVMRNGKVASGSWWIVPQELHKPLQQNAVLLSRAKDKDSAKAFLTFLKSAKAKQLMRDFGYEFP